MRAKNKATSCRSRLAALPGAGVNVGYDFTSVPYNFQSSRRVTTTIMIVQTSGNASPIHHIFQNNYEFLSLFMIVVPTNIRILPRYSWGLEQSNQS